MRAQAFFEEATREKTAAAVKAIEAQTAAEVVVAVRRASGQYRHTDYLVGFALSLAALVAMLYLPIDFSVELALVNVVLSFATGAGVSAILPGLRRRLTSRALLEENVRTAARAAFVELGVSRTSGRTGLLVFVSVFEQRVEVVVDVGVNPSALGREWEDAQARLSAAVASSASPEDFLQALRLLASPLARAYPRAADDINELSDTPQAA